MLRSEMMIKSMYFEADSNSLFGSAEKQRNGIENFRPMTSARGEKPEYERVLQRRVQQLQDELNVWRTKCAVIQRSKAQEIEDFQKSFYVCGLDYNKFNIHIPNGFSPLISEGG